MLETGTAHVGRLQPGPGAGGGAVRQLGSRYALERVVGRGATGEVWLAHETDRDGDAVAVKVLRPEYVDDGEVVARFLRERNVLRSVRSAHVVGVRDLVVEGATLAIVMEYVPRADLRAFLRDNGGALAPAIAVELTRQVLDALDAVHTAGVVHRDVKPENVLVDVGGDGSPVAKLSDFGVSRLLDGVTLTRVTGLIGTPRYMAPELGSGADPSAASDLYAVGVMLYELLTGRVPFAAEHPVAMLRAHVEQQPTRPGGIDPQLWKVLSRLLAKNPSTRYADAAAVMRDLDAVAPRLVGLRPLTDPRAEHTLHPTSQRRHDRRSIPGPSFWRRHSTDPRAEHVPRFQHPRLMLSTAVFAVVALVAALLAVLVQGGAHDAGERAWIDTYQHLGYSVSRDWSLTGKHGDVFNATETVLPMVASLTPSAQTYTLVVPKQLAKRAQDVAINAPIVKPDPVFAVSLVRANATTPLVIKYTIHVPPKGRHSSRLDAWNNDLLRARRAFEKEAPNYKAPKTTKSTPDLSLTDQHTAALEAFPGHPGGGDHWKHPTTIILEPPPTTTTTTTTTTRPQDPCQVVPRPADCPQPGPQPAATIRPNTSEVTMTMGDAPFPLSFTEMMADGRPASAADFQNTKCTPADPSVTCAVTPAGTTGTATITAVKPTASVIVTLENGATATFTVTVNAAPPGAPANLVAAWDPACTTDACTLTVSFDQAAQGTDAIGGYHVCVAAVCGDVGPDQTSFTLTMDPSGNITGAISGQLDPSSWPQPVTVSAFDVNNLPSGTTQNSVDPPPPFQPVPPPSQLDTGTTPST